MKAGMRARRVDLAFWLALALGIVTAFFRLDGHGLWGDEIWQALWARQQDLLETILRFRAPPDFPLHFVLVQITTAAGTDPLWVRLPSAVLGTLTVPLLYSIGKKNLDKITGIVAAILLAVSPFHVWFAQDARPYAALAFYSLLSLFFFIECLRKPTWTNWLGLTIATTLNLYNHFFALMPILSEGVGMGVWLMANLYNRPGRRIEFARVPWRVPIAFVTAVVTAFLGALPLLPGYASFILARGPGEVEAPPFQLSIGFLTELFGMFGAGDGWSLVVYVLLGLIGLGAAARRRKLVALIGCIWLALPLLVLWLAQPRHIFIPRYFLFQQPVYLLFVGYGIVGVSAWLAARARTFFPARASARFSFANAAGILLCGMVMAPLLPPAWQSYWVERINDWGTMCEYLHRHATAADAVAGDGYIIGLMMWCYPEPKTMPILDGNRVPLESLKHRGLNIWFLNMDGRNAAWLEKNFQMVPRDVWGKGDLLVTAASGDFKFLQAERVAQLWHYETTDVPSQIVLHDFPPDAESDKGFAEISDYTRYAVRLRLPPTQPRVLALCAQDRAGGALQVFVDGQFIGRFRPKNDSRAWRTVEFALPAQIGETFLVELFNAPKQGARVQEIQVQYKSVTATQ